MTTPAAALINLLGFITGSALYAMLLVMVLNQPRRASSFRTENRPDGLPLLTGVLGLAWNCIALATIGLHSFGVEISRPILGLLNAMAFTALGFLPAVVVNSVLRTRDGLKDRAAAFVMTVISYALSGVAGVLHFYHALVFRFAPSHWALHTLTIGFIGLMLALLVYTRRQPGRFGQDGKLGHFRWKRAGWVVALAVFAVSALHLSHHEGQHYSWWIELIGHHASLPLALAILYQDYRFALADIFLKRALSLVLLVALAFGLYLGIGARLIGKRNMQGDFDPVAVGLLLGLWIATAIIYPVLRRVVNRFVDAIILHRADYEDVRDVLAQRIAVHESPEDVLNDVCSRLAEALTAIEVRWRVTENGECYQKEKSRSGPLLPLIHQRKNSRRLNDVAQREAAVTGSSKGSPGSNPEDGWRTAQQTVATVLVPTSESPQYQLLIGELVGGRQLLSDDLALLESAGVMAARRIDAVRVVHERCVRDLHEEEMHKLATQAELRALRAQINPHFLFNALTTIGYLIQTAPERALQTLLQLTALLRGVLRQSDGEFSTLGEEIELIKTYLEIERARFEDRLRVIIDVPAGLSGIGIPALLIQPLVENAIKHGISPQRVGGEVVILARLADGNVNQSSARDNETRLQIWVRDTGAGASEAALEHGRKRGVGLSNVEQRMRRHFGEAAIFKIRSAPGVGTTVELELPVKLLSDSSRAANASEIQTEVRRKQA